MRSSRLGSDLEVTAEAAPRLGTALGTSTPDAAWLEWDDRTTGTSHRIRMATRPGESAHSRVFEARLPRLGGAVRYRVTTAPVASRRFEVKAVEPPNIATIAALVQPPPYTKIPAGPARDPSRLDVVEGTAIAFTLAPSRPVERVELAWPTFAASAETTRTIDATQGPARVVAEAAGSYPFTTRARRDEYGLDGPVESHRLVVRPDLPPTLGMTPVEAKEASPDDVLTIPLAARDDFAVASAELHFTVARGNSEGIEPASGKRRPHSQRARHPARGGQGDGRRGRARARPDDILTYKVRIADNRTRPQEIERLTWSAKWTLAIVAKAEPMVARRDPDAARRSWNGSRRIKKENLFNRQETAPLRYAADIGAAESGGAGQGARPGPGRTGRRRPGKVVDDLEEPRRRRTRRGDPSVRPLARPDAGDRRRRGRGLAAAARWRRPSRPPDATGEARLELQRGRRPARR